MGSSSKNKYKEKESRKRRHRSDSEEHEAPKEKRHRHRRHHKDRKREKPQRSHDYESGADSDVVEVVTDDRHVATPPPPRMERSPEQQTTGGGSVESLSIDETNKLRAKLGLKPLAVNDDDDSARKKDGKLKDDLGEFYHKPAGHLGAKAKQEKLKQKLAERKEKRHLEAKLTKVKTLGESDSDDDATAWVERNRKLQEEKQAAQRRAKELEELDEQFGVSQIIESDQREKRRQKYTEKNLKGIRVEHDVEDISEGKSVVLTLKDKAVLDEEDDVLVNVNMVDDERYKKNVENMKKKNPYNAYDIDDLDEFGNPNPKSLLYKYDEEIEGAKKKTFVIGEVDTTQSKQSLVESVKAKLANKRLETLMTSRWNLASDYYNEEELAKFKKPKKKGRKLRAKGKILTADELEQQVDRKGIEDIGTRRPKLKAEDFDIDDMPSIETPTDMKIEEKDDELERALHKARKVKQKEDVISDLLASTAIKTEEDENVDGGAIVLNATAEFCRTLGDIPTYGKSGNREEIDDMLDFEKDLKQDDDMEEDVEKEDMGGWNSVDPNAKAEVPVIMDTEVPILDEEPDVSAGVGAALKLAMSKGYLEREQNNRPSNSRLAHLQAKHYSIEDKSYGEEGGDRVNNRRERYAGPIQDFKERDGFKPNVKLEYIDDEGHVLNSKEAFRYLSHKFHGKGPGKNKIEKRIKKSVQEGLMKKMSSTDTPLGTLNMLQAKQKEMQSPYIVLSGSKHTHSSTAISKPRR